MNSAQLVQWRCRGCGLACSMGASECDNCGTARPGSSQERLRLLSNALHNEGNGSVQNNVNNLALQGGVRVNHNYYEINEDEEKEEPPPRQSALSKFFMIVSAFAILVGTMSVLLVMIFFVCIVIKAFT